MSPYVPTLIVATTLILPLEEILGSPGFRVINHAKTFFLHIPLRMRNTMCVNTIGSRIRWARETAGLTTREIASATGVAIGYTTAVELGKVKSPGAESLLKIADALGVDAGWLLTGLGALPDEDALRTTGAALKPAADVTAKTGTEHG